MWRVVYAERNPFNNKNYEMEIHLSEKMEIEKGCYNFYKDNDLYFSIPMRNVLFVCWED